MIYKLYNNQIHLKFDEDKHIYSVDDRTVNGVTSILQVINKPALMPWVAKTCGDFLQKNLSLKMEMDEIEKTNFIKAMKSQYRKKTDDAASIGTLAHHFMESYGNYKLKKSSKPLLPKNEEARNSCLAFLDWVKQNNVQFVDCEFKIYSKKFRYAGTCDLDCVVNGERAIIDYKTSSGIWDEYGMQLAAYQMARVEEGYESYQKRLILRVPKNADDFEVKEFPNLADDFKGFLSAFGLYRWQQNVKKKKK